jgi:hypothetical protein
MIHSQNNEKIPTSEGGQFLSNTQKLLTGSTAFLSASGGGKERPAQGEPSASPVHQTGELIPYLRRFPMIFVHL